MVCIYCSSKTQVTNSRPQKRLHQTWRRRQCKACGAIFTTTELIDMSTSVIVKHPEGSMTPFSRDRLYLSVLKAVGHRESAIGDAGALTATIIAKLHPKAKNAALSTQDITTMAYETLKRFDSAAAVQYRAYHKR